MAASNRLQDLDAALLRPGRFDRQLLVGTAGSQAARGDPARAHARASRSRRTFDLQLIARQTSGLTGADLANITNEAAILAGRENLQVRQRARLRRRHSSVSSPACRRAGPQEKERRMLAYHEAGHALMSHLMGEFRPLQKVTIVSRGTALGYALPPADEDRYLERRKS